MKINVRDIFDEVRSSLSKDADVRDVSSFKQDVMDALFDLSQYLVEQGYPIDKIVDGREKGFMRLLLANEDILNMKAITFDFTEWSAKYLDIEMRLMDLPKTRSVSTHSICEDNFDEDMTKAIRLLSGNILSILQKHTIDHTPEP